jgi:hypothetical protein
MWRKSHGCKNLTLPSGVLTIKVALKSGQHSAISRQLQTLRAESVPWLTAAS